MAYTNIFSGNITVPGVGSAGTYSASYEVNRVGYYVQYVLSCTTFVYDGWAEAYGACTIDWQVGDTDVLTESIPAHGGEYTHVMAVYILEGTATDSTKPAWCRMQGLNEAYFAIPFPAGGGFAVTFNANGGTTPTASKTVYYAQTYGALPTPGKNYHTFAGWFTAGGAQVTAATRVEITGNQTLYARWTPNTYTVTYDANDGSGRTDTRSFSYGSSTTIIDGLTRDKYVFTGWNTAADGSGTAYQPGASYGAPANVTLYAQWKQANVPVFLNAGGTVKQAEKVYANVGGTVKECTAYVNVGGAVKTLL